MYTSNYLLQAHEDNYAYQLGKSDGENCRYCNPYDHRENNLYKSYELGFEDSGAKIVTK
jgi:hypothetical protein